MFLFDTLSKKTTMPTEETALPGREEALAVPETHFVNGRPLKGPYPDGFKTVLLGMGCFWGAERLLWKIPGVWVTAAGYSGGITPNPTYHETTTGLTGHTEVVLVVYDPTVVTLETLLKAFFEAHRQNYKWDAPKYKGYLVETTSDSITALAKQRIAEVAADSVVTVLRKEFGKNLKVTRVLVAKGENAKVDSEMFGTDRVVAADKDKYKDYFVFGRRLIAKPEEVADVRGLVVADYQNYLEGVWDEQLHKKYTVEIDKKVLKQVK